MEKRVLAILVLVAVSLAVAPAGAKPLDDAAGLGDRPDSPRIEALAEAIGRGDAEAPGRFWREVDGKAPLVEPIDGDAGRVRVTFLWRGNARTRRVFLIGGVPGGDETLDRLAGTDLWYLTERIPVRARFGYMFLVDYPKMVAGEFSRNPFPRPDPLNPSRLGLQSIVELPGAPAQSWIGPGGPRGRLEAVAVRCSALEAAPSVWAYTPSGYDAGKWPHPLLIALDGEVAGGKPEETLIPVPSIVENLAAAGKIPRTLVVLVGSGDQAARGRNLRGSDRFADYLAKDLVPAIQARYGAGTEPSRTVVAGQSNGGLAAAHAALRHPEVFGGVLSQSGSFWYAPSVGASHAASYDTETGWLTREYVSAPRRDVRFYLEVGLFEQGAVNNMVLENRRFRDVLEAKGYAVTYSEYLGGHDYCCWRGSIADGLIALLGRVR